MKLHKLLEECTFKPNLDTTKTLLASSKSYQNLQTQANQVFRDITEKIKTQKSKLIDHNSGYKTPNKKGESGLSAK